MQIELTPLSGFHEATFIHFLDASYNSGTSIASLNRSEKLEIIIDSTSRIHLSYACIY